MENCPFCGGSDIRYSIKTSTSNFTRIYHACFYCWDCNTYGPRVLYKPETGRNSRDVAHKNEMLKQAAAEKWNSRC